VVTRVVPRAVHNGKAGPPIVDWRVEDDGTISEQRFDDRETDDVLSMVWLGMKPNKRYYTPADGPVFLEVAQGMLSRMTNMTCDVYRDDRPRVVPT
jgi:hypothetical protein